MLEIKKYRIRNLRRALFGIALLGSFNAQAESGFMFGLGVSYEEGVYLGSKENDVSALPYIAYETERLHIGIDGISYVLKAEETFQIEIFGKMRDLDGLKNDAFFSAIKRDTAFEIGLRGEYEIGPFVLNVSSQADVTDSHEGFETRIGIGTGADIMGGELGLTFSGVYRDEKLNHYLYGVNQKDAIPGAALFEPKAGWSSELEATYVYPISKKVALFATSSISFLSDEAKDSPRLKNNTDEKGSGFLGLLWKF